MNVLILNSLRSGRSHKKVGGIENRTQDLNCEPSVVTTTTIIMELKKQAYGLIIVTMFSGWLQQDNFWTEQRCQFFG